MPTPFTGPAGEHYVLYCLLQREYIAGLAPQNAPNQDIIATNINGTKTAAIQVKTRRPRGRDAGWHMKEKHEDLVGNRMFYCFVDLKESDGQTPDVYILPSRVVATVLKETNRIYHSQLGKKGQKRKKTKMRRLLPDHSKTMKLNAVQSRKYGKDKNGESWMKKYQENWSILGLD